MKELKSQYRLMVWEEKREEKNLVQREEEDKRQKWCVTELCFELIFYFD